MSRERWYVKVGSREVGPFSTDQLRARAEQGQLQGNTLVRLAEDDEFYEAGEYRQLAWLRTVRRPAPPPPPPSRSSPSTPSQTGNPSATVQRSLLIGLGIGTAVSIVALAGVGVVFLVRAGQQAGREVPKLAEARPPVAEEEPAAPEPPPHEARAPAAAFMPVDERPAAQAPEAAREMPLADAPKPKPAAEAEPAPKPQPEEKVAEAPLPPKPELNPKRLAPIIPEVKQPATKESFAELQKTLKKTRKATDALALYEAFANTWTFTPEQKAQVDTELAQWKEKADQDLVLLGKKWVPAAEAETAAKDAEHIIKQALALMEIGSLKEAVDRLEEASTADPNAIRADFTLALIYSAGFTGMYDAVLAEKHYRKVLNRYPDHLSALNNIALVQIKQKKYDVAFEALERLSEIAPRCREMSQNVGRVLQLAESKRIRVPEGQLKRYSRVYSELIASGKGRAASSTTGWLHMPLYLPDAERLGDEKAKEFVAFGQGTGFVVAPGMVLTNRHVVHDEEYDLGVVDAVKIADPTDPEGKRELTGTVVAVSDDADLALVKFENLELPPLEFSSVVPRLSEEVMILGYPQAQAIGSNLKSITGRVSGVSREANDPLLLDAVSNQGNSGGPVFDKSGRVIAVYTWVLTVGSAVKTQYGGGIGTGAVSAFLKDRVNGIKIVDAMPGADEWAEVTERVGKSVLKLDTYYSAGSPQLLALSAKSNRGRSYLEDLTCPDCDGRALVDCPQRGCVKGVVSQRVMEQRVQRRDNGNVMYTVPVTRKLRCQTCGGKGGISCQGCILGYDTALLRGSR